MTTEDRTQGLHMPSSVNTEAKGLRSNSGSAKYTPRDLRSWESSFCRCLLTTLRRMLVFARFLSAASERAFRCSGSSSFHML